MLEADLKTEFPFTAERAYLDTAAEGLLPETAKQAVMSYLNLKQCGSAERPDFYSVEARVTEAAAKLLGATPDSIALLSSSSEGINHLANSIDWRPGDEVVTSELEFPSGVLPWLNLENKGVRLSIVPSDRGALRREDFESAITERTRLICVSYVSYLNGTRLPFLPELAKAAQRVGALLLVDATQGLGRVPLDLDGIDYLVCSSYKWLMGIHGVGFAYLGPRLRETFRPSAAGWYAAREIFTPYRFERFNFKESAARMQPGMPNFAALYGLEQSLGLLARETTEERYARLEPLMDELYTGISKRGYHLLTPAGREFRSGIVSFTYSDPKTGGEALRQQGVLVWAGDRRVRVSVHIYNDEGDIGRFLDALSRLNGS
jgi:selenocysteine lyase/cysteine desulfurase